MQSDAWDFLVGLRKNVLTAITGIENAEFGLNWDNTTPNSTTRRRLQEILRKALMASSAFGVYVVTRHTDCGRSGHKYDYAMSNPYGLDISYRDERYLWNGDQLFQGSRWEICPCSKNNDPTDHNVIDDVIYDPKSDPAFCRALYRILSDISDAIEQAEDKRPRSAIREYLLRAVIRLNDAILPASVDEYISQESQQRNTVE